MNECCNCLFSQHAHTHGPLDMHGGSVGVNGEGVGEKNGKEIVLGIKNFDFLTMKK